MNETLCLWLLWGVRLRRRGWQSVERWPGKAVAVGLRSEPAEGENEVLRVASGTEIQAYLKIILDHEIFPRKITEDCCVPTF